MLLRGLRLFRVPESMTICQNSYRSVFSPRKLPPLVLRRRGPEPGSSGFKASRWHGCSWSSSYPHTRRSRHTAPQCWPLAPIASLSLFLLLWCSFSGFHHHRRTACHAHPRMAEAPGSSVQWQLRSCRGCSSVVDLCVSCTDCARGTLRERIVPSSVVRCRGRSGCDSHPRQRGQISLAGTALRMLLRIGCRMLPLLW